ncbi:MAG: efflux RND transporter periplasmic adaptor subunit [Anaerolineaceae bacterium]|nr:efflux RND transporter periplasmic adaptor subunit [Anaerolineaceae bacterium]
MKNKLKSKFFYGAIALVIILIIVAAVVWQGRSASEEAAMDDATTYTATVEKGDIILSATGTGELITSREINLSFTADGIVDAVNVLVGESVEEGEALAEIRDKSSLVTKVNAAKIELDNVKQTLEDVQNNGASAIAEAQLAVADAQEAYDEAYKGQKSSDALRCDEDAVDAYYNTYIRLLQVYNGLVKEENSSEEYYINYVLPAKQDKDQAYATYVYCAGYTEAEVMSSQATLTIAKAALEKAKEELEKLVENDGIDEDALLEAQNIVELKTIAYEEAQSNLDGATLTAPFKGVIMSVDDVAGDAVEEGKTFITVAEMDKPTVQFYVDETDLDMVFVGEDAEVVFDAFPSKTYIGTVIQIDPSLQSYGAGYQVLTGLIELTLTDVEENNSLPIGLTCSVDIIGGKSENTIIVPIEALRDLGDDTYSVFKLVNGEPTFTMIEVGLMDYSYAEILSGLNVGDVVTTGIVEVN